MSEQLHPGYAQHDGETVLVGHVDPDGTAVITWPNSPVEHTVPASEFSNYDD